MGNNREDEGDEGELLEQLKVFNEMKKRSTFRHRLCRIWTSVTSSKKLRSAFGHFGLMISLSIYCVVGGVVSIVEHLTQLCTFWPAHCLFFFSLIVLRTCVAWVYDWGENSQTMPLNV